MKPNDINSIIDLAFAAREQGRIFNPLFVGAPGLGKTEIVEAYCKQRNLPSVTLTAATLEAMDLRGFPSVQTINGKPRLSFVTPEFWPEDGKGVIILEEVNRGTTSVMNAVMALTDARRGFDNYKLPNGWIVVGCINPENEMNDVNTMDSALKDRFEMFTVEYDRALFLNFMRQNKWDESVTLFVETGTWQYKLPEDIGDAPGAKYTSPRTISKLNTAIQAGIAPDMELEVFQTILGKIGGKSFYHFRYEDLPVSYEDLLNNRSKALRKLQSFSDPKNYKNSHISITIKNILENETKNGGTPIADDLLVDIYLALPVDQGNSLLTELRFVRDYDKEILKRLAAAYPKLKVRIKDVLGNK